MEMRTRPLRRLRGVATMQRIHITVMMPSRCVDFSSATQHVRHTKCLTDLAEGLNEINCLEANMQGA
eukprot:4523531-Amphidinium_carterae.3